MKTKKQFKLVLTKETVANLDDAQMKLANGGITGVLCESLDCPTGIFYTNHCCP